MNQEPISKSLDELPLFCLEVFAGLVVIGFMGFLCGVVVGYFRG